MAFIQGTECFVSVTSPRKIVSVKLEKKARRRVFPQRDHVVVRQPIRRLDQVVVRVIGMLTPWDRRTCERGVHVRGAGPTPHTINQRRKWKDLLLLSASSTVR
ncbi:hypothetical protein HCEG_04457 [Histoplasma capsulatum var. duboisii H88]|uniref:Uncharacterized protein n=2 Tax=Ajellomyces capsulatus TaxID=5037 RepID=F0UH55_AJEC8|nr:hypothetical protein HCDG_06168 [Histoplasma capsulatum H143]EGC45242.1 hypothetical protein HCEG_04457 [Histoplasma capsulatum var. duboisii H88]